MSCLLNRKLNLLFTFLIATCIFSSCGNQKNLESTKNLIDSSPKIIFLNYSIEETTNGKRTIQFINKKIVDGKLKENPSESIENGTAGDLIFSELNKKSKVLNQILIKNPLVRQVEYLNDSKQFQTKTITSDKMHFSIRLQLKSNTKHITISNFAKNKPLIKTQIK